MNYLMEIHEWEFGKGSYTLDIPYTGLVLSIYPERTFNAIDADTGKMTQYNTPQGQRLHCAVQLSKMNIKYVHIHTEEEFYQLMIGYMRAHKSVHDQAIKELSQQEREIL